MFMKVLRWFPLIPRLVKMYERPSLAKLMVWHSENRSTDGTMRLVVDSPAHHHIETTYPMFAQDPRNVRLGLASDGISPFGTMRSKYSCWPVVLMNYNIPPWMALQKGHIMLSLVLPGN
ncbi:hypothetical protein GMA10_12985 [Kocuria koreensis]|uniref:Uncharacterized protein n=1 Tax=Rothia koreensis TaxID=592378 RepID=A0A7M4BQA9_9MICC|nr:hypothetical protein [Rothia koreensis]